MRWSGIVGEVGIKRLGGRDGEDGGTEYLANSSGRISTRFSSSSNRNGG